jgi:hypothetical protein
LVMIVAALLMVGSIFVRSNLHIAPTDWGARDRPPGGSLI